MWYQKLFPIAVSCLVVGFAMSQPLSSESMGKDDKPSSEQKKPSLMKAFMKVKLSQAQGILEGLTTEDFELIERNASAMFLLTKAEQWKASKDPQFVRYSDEFARVTTQLAKAAKEKNLDGASLSYMQLTLNCIECHKHVRASAITIRESTNE